MEAYKYEVKVRKEHMLENNIDPEYIFRDSVHALINDLTFEKLKDLFEFEKIDLNSPEFRDKVMNRSISPEKVYYYQEILQNGVILFETKLKR